jgi:hypothetical protein
MTCFSTKLCSWINEFVSRGSVTIKVNDKVGRYFQTKKGLRQGDTLSPLLFNLVADMLATLITRAREEGQIDGSIPFQILRNSNAPQKISATLIEKLYNTNLRKN